MPTMLCRSCGKIIPLTPVECPQCGARQERTAVPSKPSPIRVYVIGALLFGLASGFAGGFYSGLHTSPPPAKPFPQDFPPIRVSPARPVRPPERMPTPPRFPPNFPPGLPQPPLHYQITFAQGSVELTPQEEGTLASIADKLGSYPFQNITIFGHACASESDAPNLAAARAFLVKALLSDRYGVKKELITARSHVGAREMYKVDLFVLPKRGSIVGSAQ
ncbi:MAG: OmpA family protein [Elusimicrobiota bacterium]